MQANEPVKVLFLCTGNSCRSQMAEGWARHLHAGRIDAYSAGIEVKPVDPRAVAVMAEAGVDISQQRSKHVHEVMNIPFDYVITVCSHAQETCPLFPGRATILHQGFDDPPYLAKSAASEEEALSHYRRVRDEIRSFVERLAELRRGNRGEEHGRQDEGVDRDRGIRRGVLPPVPHLPHGASEEARPDGGGDPGGH